MPCTFLAFGDLHHYPGQFLDDKEARWEILRRANEKRPHTVMLSINGHHHRDHCTVMNGVCCLDLNSAAYQYIDPPFRGYAPEVLALCNGMAYTLNFSEPLSALITLEGDAKIHIRGLTGEFMFDLTDEDVASVDGGRLSYARRSVPFIRDYTVDLERQTVQKSRE